MTQDELRALVTGDRLFNDVAFAPDLSLDDLDLTESRFERCRFALPAVRGTDFSRSRFKDCHFAPTRFANCKFAKADLSGCTLFDVEEKAGLIVALCDMHALVVDMTHLRSGEADS